VDKPNLTTLDIRCPCNQLNPLRMVLVSTRPATFLTFEKAIYQCPSCGRKKAAVWHPETALSYAGLEIEDY